MRILTGILLEILNEEENLPEPMPADQAEAGPKSYLLTT
jgi:hypothetical protein